jgi:hypothetical protein
MRLVSGGVVGGVVAALLASSAAMAQSYYDDQACRQYADAQTAPLRDQANAQTFGGTLGGAALGAALGAAVGGGRGAGIGAASGAILGTGVGAANAQNTSAYLQQQYNAYYSQCMASRSGPPPGYGQAPGYPPPPGYSAPSGYAPGYPSSGGNASDLNQQELNRVQGAPSYPYSPAYPPR